MPVQSARQRVLPISSPPCAVHTVRTDDTRHLYQQQPSRVNTRRIKLGSRDQPPRDFPAISGSPPEVRRILPCPLLCHTGACQTGKKAFPNHKHSDTEQRQHNEMPHSGSALSWKDKPKTRNSGVKGLHVISRACIHEKTPGNCRTAPHRKRLCLRQSGEFPQKTGS